MLRAVIAAALPAVLARRDLRRIGGQTCSAGLGRPSGGAGGGGRRVVLRLCWWLTLSPVPPPQGARGQILLPLPAWGRAGRGPVLNGGTRLGANRCRIKYQNAFAPSRQPIFFPSA